LFDSVPPALTGSGAPKPAIKDVKLELSAAGTGEANPVAFDTTVLVAVAVVFDVAIVFDVADFSALTGSGALTLTDKDVKLAGSSIGCNEANPMAPVILYFSGLTGSD